jgi:U3 small nucleolar RNA-associated protein 21
MQSGQHRLSLPLQNTKIKPGRGSEALQRGHKHTKAVTGLALDALNRTAVSCGLDGKVKVRY